MVAERKLSSLKLGMHFLSLLDHRGRKLEKTQIVSLQPHTFIFFFIESFFWGQPQC